MKIAIIGAGFSGLATAWKLLEAIPCQVTLFDPKGVGGGASGVASGLMHPYVGEQARRSQLATEGMAATRLLLSQVEAFLGRPVARYEGIVRIAQTEEQDLALNEHVHTHGDVQALGNRAFRITSGVTVHCASYLSGLFQMIAARGAVLERVRIEDLSALAAYDAIVIAAGSGVAHFTECRGLGFKLTKGQVLIAQASKGFIPLEQSLIGKGYIALGEGAGEYYLGSTYEKKFVSDEPCLETAKDLILPKIAQFFPEAAHFTISGCKAGIRVVCPHHYFPLVSQINARTWVFTGLGSRGLLYHALLAETVVKMM